MTTSRVNLSREGNEVTVELIDEDGNSFFKRITDNDPDAHGMYSGELTAVEVEGPMKVNGEFKPSTTVAFLLADEIEVAPSSELKFLALKSGTFTLRQSVFLTVDGKRTEITMDSLPLDEN